MGRGADIRLLTSVAKQLVNLAKAPSSGISVIRRVRAELHDGEGGLQSESTPHLKTEVDALTSDGLPQPACATGPDLTVLNLRLPERKERTIGGWPNCVC